MPRLHRLAALVTSCAGALALACGGAGAPQACGAPGTGGGVASAACGVAPAAGRIADRGGPLLASPRVHALWLGDRAAFGDAPAAVERALSGLGATPWASGLAEYLRGAAAAIAFAGHHSAPDPGRIGVADVGSAVCAAIAAGGARPDAGAVHLAYVQRPTADAWHGWTTCQGARIAIALVVVGAGIDFGQCDAQERAASWAVAASTHELAEAMTDPFPDSAWRDASGGEIADGCGTTCIPIGGTVATVARYWSNAAGACVP